MNICQTNDVYIFYFSLDFRLIPRESLEDHEFIEAISQDAISLIYSQIHRKPIFSKIFGFSLNLGLVSGNALEAYEFIENINQGKVYWPAQYIL